MKVSIIIPTHNRARELESCLESIARLDDEADYEVIAVDNNSSDNTPLVVSRFPFARYVFEPRTAFSRARSAGASSALGNILLFIDDDTLVMPGSLRNLVAVFAQHPECGVVAGKISPQFVESPPAWTIACQRWFNAWSLFSPENYDFLQSDFQEVTWAAGPMMAVRKDVFDEVGGFPPDTVGVETNWGARTFHKLYIGPGDYGLCHLVREAGYKIYYDARVAVQHVIPPVRLTIGFWRSRVIGEGYHKAITQRAFFRSGRIQLFKIRLETFLRRQLAEYRLLRAMRMESSVSGASARGMRTEELQVHFYQAYLDMDLELRRHGNLCHFLWTIGKNGVSDAEFDDVQHRIPDRVKALFSSQYVSDSIEVRSADDFHTHWRRRRELLL